MLNAPELSKSNFLNLLPKNFRAYKALVAAKFSGTPVEVASDFKYGETNKTDDFLNKFPLGKTPALETKDGQFISDHNAISFYLANDQLRGSDVVTQSQVLQWLSFADNELLQSVVTLVFPVLKILQVSGDEMKKANEQLTKSINALEKSLNNKKFLVGNQVTLADFAVATYLIPLLQHVWDNEKLAKFKNVNQWFENLIKGDEFSVLGDLKLKQAKKSAAPAQAAAGDEESLVPKPKDPFAKFPKSDFDMDAFKREYSNKSEDESIKYFWEKFDKENYSIWYCEYLYPQELTKVFMSCNLIGGMMQRLDRMRKHAFGSMCLFGEDNNSTISGVWFWKGHELAFTLADDLTIDYESYSWKKLDPDAPETKKLVDEYFRWEGEFGDDASKVKAKSNGNSVIHKSEDTNGSSKVDKKNDEHASQDKEKDESDEEEEEEEDELEDLESEEEKKPKSKKPKKAVSEEEDNDEEYNEDDDDEEEEYHSKKKTSHRGRPSRRAATKKQQVTYDDFDNESEEEVWSEESEDERAVKKKTKRGKKKSDSEDSDWEMEHKGKSRRSSRKNDDSDEESESDWENEHKGGRSRKQKAKPTRKSGRAKNTPSRKSSRRKKASSESEEDVSEDEKVVRKPCKDKKRCLRKNPAHIKQFSHPGDSDFESDEGSISKESESEGEEDQTPKKKQLKGRPKRESAKKSIAKRRRDEEDESEESEDEEEKPTKKKLKNKSEDEEIEEEEEEEEEDLDELKSEAKKFVKA
ncbi:hypothetical protein RND71_044077 [Anisodus tanguticus]|uniref:Elongation factor 1-gamma n=1 Tax=Anisodus tanguticus TaxID=243964 RepID=A0AAE1QPH1_9SOLA|nr:hypothetical protein RND71_044077 [Anisodus tanguticus]